MKLPVLPEPLKKYGALGLIILVGLLLLLWPKGAGPPPETPQAATFDHPVLEARMEEILSSIQGAGRVNVMLTRKTDSEAVVFQGALIVCDGANTAKVQSAILDAVAALTGLRADAITIAKRKG